MLPNMICYKYAFGNHTYKLIDFKAAYFICTPKIIRRINYKIIYLKRSGQVPKSEFCYIY